MNNAHLVTLVVCGFLAGARTYRGWLVVGLRYDEVLYVKGDAVILSKMMAASRNGCWKRQFAAYRRGADHTTARPLDWCDTLTDAIGWFED